MTAAVPPLSPAAQFRAEASSADASSGVHLNAIESLRGVAALMVLFYHLAELLKLPVPDSLAIMQTHFGLGVPLFYALSGFVLAFGYAGRLGSRDQVVGFYTRRFFRIAPLFYFMLVTWLAVNWVVLHSTSSSQTLFLNFSFLFGLVPGAHESVVWAGWSIGIEMLFYALFPIAIVVMTSVWSGCAAFLVSCILSAAVYNAFTSAGLTGYAYMNLATHLPFFVAGIVCFRIWERLRFAQVPLVGLALLLVAAAASVVLVKSDGLYTALVKLRFGAAERNAWAVVFGLLILSVCMAPLTILQRGPLRSFGKVSFSIYLTHPLVMLVLLKSQAVQMLSEHVSGTNFVFAVGAFGTLAVVWAVSALSFRFIEQPGIALGRLIASQTNRAAARRFSWRSLTRIAPKVISAAPVATQLVAVAALLFATYIAFAHSHQPLIDVHAFRQSQTALTAYWMQQEGWAIAYQTPVAGFPWSIPFEFPIYQALAAGISVVTATDLVTVGRLLSWLFLLAGAWPAFALADRLHLPKSVPWVFCALLWSSPLYVYWGRTFMIETAALFFTLACLPSGVEILRSHADRWNKLAFVLFGAAAMLQKATTGGPIILALLCAAVALPAYQSGLTQDAMKRAVRSVAIICIPLLIGVAWAAYSDRIKQQNPFGRQLTSAALGSWNFGTFSQRLSPATWTLVVWERALTWNAAGFIGVVLLGLLVFGLRRHRRLALIGLAAFALFLLPILVFTNLHVAHEYYQVSCVVFLLAALAIVIGGILPAVTGIPLAVPALTLLMLIWNIHTFNGYYGVVAARAVSESDPATRQAHSVGRYLREHTKEGTAVAVFGQDYSSEIAFASERKSITLPPWFSEYPSFWAEPQKYSGNLPLSAIAVCPPTDKFPTREDVERRASTEAGWNHVSVDGCELLLSKLPYGISAVARP
jgi:peptidoglycan/LPS O-acetylase OafA/YrhL